MSKREARYWHKLGDGRVQCRLCPHGCKIRDGRPGICRVRLNEGGVLYTTNYGEVGSLALDPVEKKPLYHFHPGRAILSVGTVGCNLDCGFCQNYSLVRGDCHTSYVEPEHLVALAEETKAQGNIGIAYTYSEPGMWYEYVFDTARLGRNRGLVNVLVTNGYIEEKPLLELLPWVDAMNIDLKAFTESFYLHNCKARLGPVKEAIEKCSSRIHVEVTTLLIPGLNDGEEEIEKLASWLASIDSRIVLHLTRYHPARRFRLPSTPPETMTRAREVAAWYLPYVYVGNLGGVENDTRCAGCGNLLVRRTGYFTEVKGVAQGTCTRCGRRAPLVL